MRYLPVAYLMDEVCFPCVTTKDSVDLNMKLKRLSYKNRFQLGEYEIERESYCPLDGVHLRGNRSRFMVRQLLALEPLFAPFAIGVGERAIQTGAFVVVRTDEGHGTRSWIGRHFRS